MIPFTHLHVHSQYSLLDGQAAVTDLVDKALADGMPGIALTDHGNMFGIKEIYNYINGGALKGYKKKLEKATKETGYTIVPTKLFTNEKGFAKLEIALARGKKAYDKRETLKEKEDRRAMDRYLKI